MHWSLCCNGIIQVTNYFKIITFDLTLWYEDMKKQSQWVNVFNIWFWLPSYTVLKQCYIQFYVHPTSTYQLLSGLLLLVNLHMHEKMDNTNTQHHVQLVSNNNCNIQLQLYALFLLFIKYQALLFRFTCLWECVLYNQIWHWTYFHGSEYSYKMNDFTIWAQIHVDPYDSTFRKLIR